MSLSVAVARLDTLAAAPAHTFVFRPGYPFLVLSADAYTGGCSDWRVRRGGDVGGRLAGASGKDSLGE